MEAGTIRINALKEACMRSMTDRKLVIHRIWRAMKACLHIMKISKVFIQQRKRDCLQAAIVRSSRDDMQSERRADGGE